MIQTTEDLSCFGDGCIERAYALARFGRKHFGSRFETEIIADINRCALFLVGESAFRERLSSQVLELERDKRYAEAIAMYRKALPTSMYDDDQSQHLIKIEEIVAGCRLHCTK